MMSVSFVNFCCAAVFAFCPGGRMSAASVVYHASETLPAEQGAYRFDAFFIDVVFAALFAVEDRNRNAPVRWRKCTIAAVAKPCWTYGPAPTGNEFDAFDLLDVCSLISSMESEPLLVAR
jgi:hypothetical protein